MQRTYKGVVFEKNTGKWRSHVVIECCTADQPLRRVVMDLRCSNTYKNHRKAVQMRDAALLTLTNGSCSPEQLSGLPQLKWQNVQHCIAVRSMLPQVLGYNASQHVWQCKWDFLEHVNRPKSIKQLCLAASRAVSFDLPSANNQPPGVEREASSMLPTLETRQVNFPQFRSVLMQNDCNILLSSPAGTGKTYAITKVIAPTLYKRYNKSKVWLTASTGLAALALGPGGATIHSQAGVGRGKGMPEDIVKAMTEPAKQRWKTVEVGWVCF